MAAHFDFHTIPEPQRIAFYGSLFAMADADGMIDKEEIALIFECLDLEGMSERAHQEVRGFLLEPPLLNDCLIPLSEGTKELRYGVMVHLMDVALADELLLEEERSALEESRAALNITTEQLAAIEQFIKEVHRIRERGLDDHAAADGLKEAASGMTAVGIPIAAVYFSGTVLGLSTAGITSGLTSLGLGLGMLPGVGVAIILGTASFLATRALLHNNVGPKHAQRTTNRSQLVVQNLQDTMDDLVTRIHALSGQADTANTDAIRELTARLHALKQLIARSTPAGRPG